MKKNYKRNWLFKFKSALVIVSFLVSGTAMAQLSGNYTLNSNSTSGGTNFASFSDLSDSISALGVSGPVVVDVVAGSGPYNEQVTFKSNGLADSIRPNATNTITINGNGEEINTVGTRSNRSVIYLNGASHFIFDNLNVVAKATENGTRCFTINKNSDSNTISNSNLVVSNYTGDLSSTAYIAFSATITSLSSGDHGTGNLIINNTMNNGSSAGGPYFGVVDYRSTLTRGVGNSIVSNKIEDFRQSGVYLYYVDGFIVNNNTLKPNKNQFQIVDPWWGSFVPEVYGIFAYYCESLVPTQINNNIINPPLIENSLYGIVTFELNSDTTAPIQVNNNEIKDINQDNSGFNGLYIRGSNVEVKNNIVDSIRVNGEVDWRGRIYYGTSRGGYFAIKKGIVSGNQISRISTSGDVYGIDFAYSSKCDLKNNRVSRLTGDDGTTSTFTTYQTHGIKTYSINRLNISNNLVDDLNGAFVQGMNLHNSPDSVFVHHNTVVLDNDAETKYVYTIAGTNTRDVKFYNNLGFNSGNAEGMDKHFMFDVRDNVPTSKIKFGSNLFYSPDTILVNYVYNKNTDTLWSDYVKNSSDVSSFNLDPKFVDMDNGDFTPSNATLANRGVTGLENTDLFGSSRTTCGPDIGAIEFFVDHNVVNSSLSAIPVDICGGSELSLSLDFTNGSAIDSVIVPMYYQIGSGYKHTELSDTIAPSATAKYAFDQDIIFNTPGNNTFQVGIYCDDDSTNNSILASINVISSPTGGTLAQGSTYDGYYNAGTELDPDILARQYTGNYDITRPTKYSSVAPGADYTYSLEVIDEDSTDLTSAGYSYTSLTEVLSITPEDSLSGRTASLSLLVTDNNTGCDTTLTRQIFMPHVPFAEFDSENICLGDVSQFKNQSTLAGPGYIQTNWEFSDPDTTVTDDNSDIKDGFWKYTTYGDNIFVKMTVLNGLYPKFTYEDVDTIVVTPKPLVDFKVLNACEGSPIQVNNNTTLPVSSPITYEWDFAGEYTTTDANPSYTFATSGQRKISVTATANGCFASLTKNAYQFEMPMAEFTSEGECNFVNVDFENSSTIDNGANMGFAWDFNSEGISRESNPSFAFAKSGTKSVTLTATSEFGCVNKFTKSIVLQESPEADFAWDAACNLTPINFTITGSLPNGGANSSFEWDFAGESSAIQADPSYLFSKVGPKMVKLTISDLNGCSSSIEKEVNVVLQAVADFEAGSVCEGEEAVFTNKSTVAAGDLTYEWTFGDGAGSSDLSPTHNYATSKTYNVKLKAIVEGGCSDEVTYPIIVNPTPDASFTLAKDGRTVVCDGPAGNDIYRWTFGDGSKDDSEDPTYTFENVDRGTFTVCLATKKGECWNDECEDITINLAGIENLTQNDDMINVYPNPTTGKFNVTVENAGEVVVKVGDILGNVLDVNVTDNMNGTYSVDMSVVADGVYFVQVKNGDYFATKRITVSK